MGKTAADVGTEVGGERMTDDGKASGPVCSAASAWAAATAADIAAVPGVTTREDEAAGVAAGANDEGDADMPCAVDKNGGPLRCVAALC